MADPKTVAGGARGSAGKRGVRKARPIADVAAMAPVPAEIATPAIELLPAAPLAVPSGKDVTMSFDTIASENTAEKMTNTAGDKAQAMFSDLNGRAKGAMEKSAAMFEDVTAFNKGNIEAIVESSKLAAKGAETLGHDVAAYAKTSFEGATEAMKTLAAAKSPTEFFKLQGDYARTAFDTLIADSARTTEMMMKMMGEIAQPISNRVAVATNKMKLSA